jgi:hypothetical protein
MVKVLKILDKEPHISSIIMTNTPEWYSSENLNMEEVVKSLANTISPDSNKNLISIHASFGVRKETIDLINEFYSKMRENGIIVYDSAQAASKSIRRLWSYGDYLKKRGLFPD